MSVARIESASSQEASRIFADVQQAEGSDIDVHTILNQLRGLTARKVFEVLWSLEGLISYNLRTSESAEPSPKMKALETLVRFARAGEQMADPFYEEQSEALGIDLSTLRRIKESDALQLIIELSHAHAIGSKENAYESAFRDLQHASATARRNLARMQLEYDQIPKQPSITTSKDIMGAMKEYLSMENGEIEKLFERIRGIMSQIGSIQREAAVAAKSINLGATAVDFSQDPRIEGSQQFEREMQYLQTAPNVPDLVVSLNSLLEILERIPLRGIFGRLRKILGEDVFGIFAATFQERIKLLDEVEARIQGSNYEDSGFRTWLDATQNSDTISQSLLRIDKLYTEVVKLMEGFLLESRDARTGLLHLARPVLERLQTICKNAALINFFEPKEEETSQ